MFKPSLMKAEWIFILGFGVFHFLVPFFLPPNFIAAVVPVYSLFWGLQLADLVTPGSIVLATLSILFVYTRNRFLMAALMVMYLGGAFFHGLYLIGFLPPLVLVPDTSFLAIGLLIDTFAAIAIYDYYRRARAYSSFH